MCRKFYQLCLIHLICLLCGSVKAQDQSSYFFSNFSGAFDIGKKSLDLLERGQGQVSENSGAYVYHYPINLPPGRGPIPSLVFTYSSSGGPSYLGDGWSLNIPWIERSTEFGAPFYINETDMFIYHDHKGSAARLVRFFKNNNEIWFKRLRDDDGTLIKYYIIDDRWIIFEKNGSHKIFNERLSFQEKGTASWYITSDKDKLENETIYRYFKNQTFIAPESITYSTNKALYSSDKSWEPSVMVAFNYESNRTNSRLDCRSGVCVNIYGYKINNISIFVKNLNSGLPWVIRKKYSFSYESIESRFLLKKIETIAWNAEKLSVSLPAVSFNYENNQWENKFFKQTTEICNDTESMNSYDLGYSVSYPIFNPINGILIGIFGIRNTIYSYSDMNGDGIQDKVFAGNKNLNVSYGRLDENGILSYSNAVPWNINVKNQDSFSWNVGYGININVLGFPSFSYSFIQDTKNNSAILATIQDFNGDGLADYGATLNRSTVCINNGQDGCDEQDSWPIMPAYVTEKLSDYDTYLVHAPIDINGDGLVDSVSCDKWNEGQNWRVSINKGNGKSETVDWPGPMLPINLKSNGGIVTYIALIDMNGDGLVDIVNQPARGIEPPRAIEVYLNKGDGFKNTPDMHWNAVAYIESKLEEDSITYSLQSIIDINDDKLPDILQYFESEMVWKLKLNTGYGFGDWISINISDKYMLSYGIKKDTSESYYNRFVDINGDGITDRAYPEIDKNNYPNFSGCDKFILSDFKAISKLKKIDNGMGGLTEIQYMPSTYAKNSHIPHPFPIVSEIRLTINGNSYIKTKYKYWNGLFRPLSSWNYNRYYEKEYRGFRETSRVDYTTGLSTSTEFDQSDAGIGSVTKIIDQNADDVTRRYYSLASYERTYKSIIPDLPDLTGSPSPTNVEKEIETIYISNNDISNRNSITANETQYNIYGDPVSILSTGVIQRIGKIELANARLKTLTYKNGMDWVNNKNIIGLKNISESWRDKDGIWHAGPSKTFYHDNDSNPDTITNGLLYLEQTKITDTESDWKKYTYYQYNGFDYGGLLKKIENASGSYKEMEYDENTHTYISSETASGINSSGENENTRLTETFVRDLATGKVLSRKDPNNLIYRSKYDGYGQLKEAYAPLSPTREIKTKIVNYTYNKTPIEIETLDLYDSARNLWRTTRAYYDGFGRLLEEARKKEPGKVAIRLYEYDSAGRVSKSYNQFEATDFSYYAEPPRGTFCKRVMYNQNDTPRKITKGVGFSCDDETVAEFYYGPDLSEEMHTWEDNEERIQKVLKDGNGNAIRKIYDPNGLNIVEEYTYDGGNRVIKAKDGTSKTIEYNRNYRGDILHTVVNGAQTWNYVYDSDGRLTSETSPLGRRVEYRYDGLGRLETKLLFRNNASEGTYDYIYDEPDHGYSIGKLTSVHSIETEINYSYDSLGRVYNQIQGNNASSLIYDTTTEFYDDGSIKSLQYPDGYKAAYEYNLLGEPSKLTGSDGLCVSRYSDSRGNLDYVDIKIGCESSVIFRHDYDFDNDGRLKSINTLHYQNSNAYTLFLQSVGYYLNDKVKNENIDGYNRVYKYDSVGRLNTVTGDLTASYLYDASNRMKSSILTGESLTYKYDNAKFPWAVTSALDSDRVVYSYRYDDDGFMIGDYSDGSVDYKYDARGMLSTVFKYYFNPIGPIGPLSSGKDQFEAVYSESESRVGVISPIQIKRKIGEFLYNHENQVINSEELKPVAGSSKLEMIKTDFVSNLFENEYERSKSRKNIMLGGVRICTIDKAGNRFFPIHDRQGSVARVVDENGATIELVNYNPYGGTQDESVTGESGSDYYYGGHRKEAGLLRFPARMYNPNVGNWTALDPGVLKTGEILKAGGVNPYNYCRNDPINRSDPSGMYDVPYYDYIFDNPYLTNSEKVDLLITSQLSGGLGAFLGLSVFTGGGSLIAAWQAGGVAGVLALIGDVALASTPEGVAFMAGTGLSFTPLVPLVAPFAWASLQRMGTLLTSSGAAETAALGRHLDSAIARFAAEGFTERQALRLIENPSLEAAFRGERIDTFFKEAVLTDPKLKHLSVTPRFQFGPDVYDPSSGIWWDVTTADQWGAHVSKYGAQFGTGMPLLYGGF